MSTQHTHFEFGIKVRGLDEQYDAKNRDCHGDDTRSFYKSKVQAI